MIIETSKEHKSNSMKCIIQEGTFSSVANLLSKDIKANPYSLQALSSVIESLILYDEIIVYDYRPKFNLFFNLSDELSKTTFANDLIKAGILSTHDPYKMLFSDSEYGEILIKSFVNSDTSFRHTDNSVASTSLLVNPSFLDFQEDPMIKNINNSLAIEALSTIAPKSFISSIKDKDSFFKRYTINNLWQIEMGKIVKQQLNADGIMIAPNWVPFWMMEKFQYATALQNKYEDYKNIISESKFKNEYNADFSPLTAIALDTSLNREMFFENLMLMRNDYSELREIGRKYRDSLKNADTYSEIEDITREWSIAWDLVMKKIKKTEVPLLRRMFGWDSLKSLSIKKIGTEALYEIYSEMENKSRINSLSIVNKIDKEYMNARIGDKRVLELFGGVDIL